MSIGLEQCENPDSIFVALSRSPLLARKRFDAETGGVVVTVFSEVDDGVWCCSDEPLL